MFEWLGLQFARIIRATAGWFLDYLVIPFFDLMGTKLASKLLPTLEEAEAIPDFPEALKPLLAEMKHPTGEIGFILGAGAAGAATGGIISSTIGPYLKLLEYAVQLKVASARLDPATALWASRRRPEWTQWLHRDLEEQGYSSDRITAMFEATDQRMSAEMLVRYKWRYGLTEVVFLQRMMGLGFNTSEARDFEATLRYYPSPQDLVMWQAREVFEPEMVAKYGLDSELDKVEKESFYKAGMDDEQITNHWRAHWQHASYTQIIEMLHRTDLTEQDMKDWFRLVEIPPFWRKRLIDIAYVPYTRVDVRRMWDIGVLDDPEVITAYRDLGYKEEKAIRMLAFTKLFQRAPDLRARFKKGWITQEQLLQELIGFGLKPDLAQKQLETMIVADKPERLEKERDLTKADIYKGVKKDVITWDQAIELLVDMGYDSWEADYILAINVPTGTTDKEVKQRELTKGDIKTGVKELLISPSQAVSRLVELRYTPADAEFLVSIYEGLVPIEKIEPERDLTKSDMLIALKKAILSPAEVRVMLQDLRYGVGEIDVLIQANMPPIEELEIEVRKQLAKADIKSALKAGLITPNEAFQRLIGLDYSEEDARFLVDTYLMLEALKKVTKPREFTKADITKGVKTGLLTQGEGYALLIELGYPDREAQYLLELVLEITERSPSTFQEFKGATQGYRKAQGMESKPPSLQLKEAEKDMRRLKAQVVDMERRLVSEDDMAPVLGELGIAEAKYREFLIQYQEG